MSNEIEKVISLRGEVVEGKTLKDLKSQIDENEKFDELILLIATRGGSVKEGLNIMIWLDEISKSGVKVVTVVEANAYSIGSMIMLAADVRLISKHGEVMVHNPMLPELKYVNANELEKHLEKLRALESDMHEIYKMFTEQDIEVIKNLMNKETYLSPDDAVKYGFADMVIDMLPKPYDEASEAENTVININMIKHINSLRKVVKLINGDDFVNLTYNTKGGSKIEIYQGDASTYKVGDKTDQKEGTVELGDGSTLVIKDFEIQDIKKEVKETKVENSNVGEAPNEDEKKDKLEDVKNSTDEDVKNADIKRVTSWQSSVENETFAVGDIVKYKATEHDPEPQSVGAGEWEIEDGRKFLTDSNGKIRMFLESVEPAVEEPATEAPAEEPATEPATEAIESEEKEVAPKAEEEVKEEEKEVAAEEEKPEEKKEDIMEQFQNMFAQFTEKMTALETKVNEIAAEKEEADKFRATATEAIETIAEQTTSNFAARKVFKTTDESPKVVGNSIFKRALARNAKAQK